jgi:C4-dicarboxylate-specific signal transduction histidine kinase
LGLWISRNLVERYGGTLQASVRTDGVSGAVFTVRLPA